MGTRTQIQKISHRHEAIIDWLLANPHVKDLGVLCKEMNVSRNWLSTLMSADLFKAEWKKRREEHALQLSQGIQLKQLRLLDESLDILNDYVTTAQEGEGGEYDPKFVLELADRTAKNLGFAPSPGGRPKIIEEREREVRTVTNDSLTIARERMRRVHVPSDAEPPTLPTSEA